MEEEEVYREHVDSLSIIQTVVQEILLALVLFPPGFSNWNSTSPL